MTAQQLKDRFAPQGDMVVTHQKASFAGLSDEDFKQLCLLDLKIRCTPQAMRYISQRRAGTLKRKIRTDGPEHDTIEQRITKAGASVETSINNPL